MKLLLIDDDIFLRDMYSLKFSSAGYDVVAVKVAEEALAELESQSFDIIVTDMVIPGMSGLEFLENIKSLPQAEKAVKIVLSNQGESSDKESAKKAGAHGYIVKADMTPSEVVTEVAAIYNSNKS